MSDEFRFKQWKVYQDARTFFREISVIAEIIPSQFRFSLTDQLLRASLSILLNIAEGSGKRSDKELNRYLNIALGSVSETAALLDVLHELKILPSQKLDELEKLNKDLARQLSGFKKHLKH